MYTFQVANDLRWPKIWGGSNEAVYGNTDVHFDTGQRFEMDQ